MYTQTTAQVEAEKTLEKQGFRFINWIDAHDGNDDHGTMVMKKTISRVSHEYREIDPNGAIN